MAVAGMNSVAVLESSYLGENYPPISRRRGNQERPITRTSFIRKMWRDLEGETRFKETERQQSIRNTGSSQCSCSSLGAESEENVSITTSEVENEWPRDHNQMELQNVQRSPALCLADKQRVRQIFREWGSKNSSNHGHHGHTSYKNNNCSRVQGGCENECKRVRSVRQWIESNSNTTREAETSGSIRRLYGRQALLDLLTRFQMERKQEIQSLLENRPVSTFNHRNRIQSLLRGRFLWNQRFIQEEKSTSNAANELGLLRQTQTQKVSDIRKGILSRLGKRHDEPQYDTSSDNSMDDQDHPDEIVNQTDTVNTITDVSQSDNVDFETNTDENPEEQNEQVVEHEENHELALIEFIETRSQEPNVEDDGSEWRNLTDLESNEGLQDSNSIENEDEWYDNILENTNTRENWYLEASDDDDNNNRPELRELVRRRRVSNLLESDFRERLDRLIQQRLEQEVQGSESDNDDWMIERENHENEEDENNNENATEVVEVETQRNDCQIIDELRVDMAILQERMNSMQKTLETCMNMQLELQRSVKQEVSSALNRSEEGEKCCFICCDNGGFDSTSDRCGGHVYVCSKCAGKIDWSKVKESVKHP